MQRTHSLKALPCTAPALIMPGPSTCCCRGTGLDSEGVECGGGRAPGPRRCSVRLLLPLLPEAMPSAGHLFEKALPERCLPCLPPCLCRQPLSWAAGLHSAPISAASWYATTTPLAT